MNETLFPFRWYLLVFIFCIGVISFGYGIYWLSIISAILWIITLIFSIKNKDSDKFIEMNKGGM